MSEEILEPDLNQEELESLEKERQEQLEREQARIEQARIEHENFLKSFPETTVFYDRIIETDTYKCLGSWTKSAHTADSFYFIPCQKNV